MVPGFTALSNQSTRFEPAVIQAAGIWDQPTGNECRFARTDTFCTGLVLWCKEVYVCNNNTLHGYEKTVTPHPCGVCVGVSNPSDW